MVGLGIADASKIDRDGRSGHQREQAGNGNRGGEAEALEAAGTDQAAEEEQAQDGRVNAQLVAVGAYAMDGVGVVRAVPIQQPADLDAQVGHDTGHVRRADLGLRDLRDDRVLQPHDETEQQHRGRHHQMRKGHQVGPQQAKQQQQRRFDHQGQCVGAMQLAAPGPVDHEGRTGGAGHEGQQ
jgi:hypothetical protein